MKIEIIKDVAGMKAGHKVTVEDHVGKDMINNGWAKDTDGKYKAKSESADDISAFLSNAGLIGEDALNELQAKEEKHTRQTKELKK